jgi:hypothetical protein
VVMGRVFVSGVIVATLDVERLDVMRLGELAPIFEDAREQRARGVVLDFPDTAVVDPSAAAALMELMVVASASLSANAVEDMVAEQSGCHRIPVMSDELELALSGLSASQCFALGAEPLLTDLVLAETWIEGVRILSSRMPTVVPAAQRKAG